MTPYKGVITDFVPDRLFGFCSVSSPSGDMRVFFHARDFHRLTPGECGPILGEEVLLESLEKESRGPISKRVVRKTPPLRLLGKVKNFDPKKKWGFLEAEGGKSFYFTQREMVGSWVPLVGSRVYFIAGNANGRTRACWVAQEKK